MSELHDALKHLGPIAWSEVPQQGQELDTYIENLLKKSQLILDSVPIPAPDDAPHKPQSQAHGRAKNAKEVTLSSERPSSPPFGHDRFQKDWGKPMKIKAQENPLGLSVYKMSGKDSKGAWFARRSIHEGLGFARFKRSMEIEFEKSLAEQGPPGSGNVRGIGGEERVEHIKTNKATVEVYRLSAQFPGPTAARDFVTFLVTSEHALETDKGKDDLIPRHYMVISRPCDHPKTQPQNGFVRGTYESIEFIREVPRKLHASQSSVDLGEDKHHKHHKSSDLDDEHARKRSVTVDDLTKPSSSEHPDPADPEDNPVEWVMITRSDPGGGIPRFLVERGTPGSICGDAVKFVDWACTNDEELQTLQSGPSDSTKLPRPVRRESRRESMLAGISESEQAQNKEVAPSHTEQQTVQTQPSTQEEPATGLFGAMAAYTPQVILDRINGSNQPANEAPPQEVTTAGLAPTSTNEDARSVSGASFVSAEEHWSSASEASRSEASIDTMRSTVNPVDSKEQLNHEKELRKLDDRKQELHKKFAETQTKYDALSAKRKTDDDADNAKQLAKHEKEMVKHKEKYEKEIAKTEDKIRKQREKHAKKAKQAADKDVKTRLTRERDEARQELAVAKQEADSLRTIVQQLQKENTEFVIKLGKAGMSDDASSISRSRNSSLSHREKKNLAESASSKDPTIASAAASLRSNESKAS